MWSSKTRASPVRPADTASTLWNPAASTRSWWPQWAEGFLPGRWWRKAEQVRSADRCLQLPDTSVLGAAFHFKHPKMRCNSPVAYAESCYGAQADSELSGSYQPPASAFPIPGKIGINRCCTPVEVTYMFCKQHHWMLSAECHLNGAPGFIVLVSWNCELRRRISISMATVSKKLSTKEKSGIFLHHTLEAHKSNILFHIIYEIYVPVS